MTTKDFRDNIPCADVPAVDFLDRHGVACKSALDRFESGEWEDFGNVPEDAPTISIVTRGGDASAQFFYDGKNWQWTTCGFDAHTDEYIEASGEEWYLFGAIREILRQGPFFGNELSATLSEARDYGACEIIYGH